MRLKQRVRRAVGLFVGLVIIADAGGRIVKSMKHLEKRSDEE